MKPVISFHVPDYSMEGASFGFDLAGEIFGRLRRRGPHHV